MYYDMDGQPISIEGWIALFDDPSQKIVAQTELPGGCLVSTVLLGIDHNYMDHGPPIIFETMVFESTENLTDIDCVRYATKEEAQAGHEAMVTKWTGWTPGEPHPEDAEPSFLTQFINALERADGPPSVEDSSVDQMVVMYPKDSPLAKEEEP